MKIKRLIIRNFGGIHEKSMEFLPGINVLYGENESGKTTVYAFLKSMFYGLRRQRGRAARNDAYALYEPWENPSVYGGTVWFENGGRNFRLSRNFSRTSPSSELLCEDDGEVMDVEQGDLDGVLGGVSEVIYENTVAVGQLKSVTGPELVKELQNYMASYQGTADSSVDLGRAMQMLKMTRKGFQVQADRRKKELAIQKEKILAHMNYVRGEMEELKEKRKALLEDAGDYSLEEEGGTPMDGRIEELARRKKRLNGFMAATAAVMILAAVLLGVFLTEGIWPVIAALTAGASALTAEFIMRRKTVQEWNKRINMREKWLHRREKFRWNMESLRESYREKRMSLGNLQSEYEEEEETTAQAEELEVEALNLAMETIEKLSGGIHNQVGDRLRRRTSEILREITGGKYGEVLMDEALHMSVNTEERIVPLERLSRGTLEQIYFALRMAAGEILCGEEEFPVILDDVFGMYDEDRLRAVLRWLEKEKRQIIISTCHRREMELLEREGIPYRQILL